MVAYRHYFVVLEQIVAHLVDLILALASTILLFPKLESVAPFQAISSALTHLTSFLALEKFVVLYWTQETWTSPFVFVVDDVVFSAILLPIKG